MSTGINNIKLAGIQVKISDQIKSFRTSKGNCLVQQNSLSINTGISRPKICLFLSGKGGITNEEFRRIIEALRTLSENLVDGEKIRFQKLVAGLWTPVPDPEAVVAKTNMKALTEAMVLPNVENMLEKVADGSMKFYSLNGPAGAGKSAILERIRQHGVDNHRAAHFVQASEWTGPTKKDSSPMVYLQNALCGSKTGATITDWIVEYSSKWAPILIVDGLDDIARNTSIEILENFLHDFYDAITKYKYRMMVVICLNHAWLHEHDILQQFTPINLSPAREDKVRSFIADIDKALPADVAMREAKITDLADYAYGFVGGNPMLLQSLADGWIVQGRRGDADIVGNRAVETAITLRYDDPMNGFPELSNLLKIIFNDLAAITEHRCINYLDVLHVIADDLPMEENAHTKEIIDILRKFWICDMNGPKASLAHKGFRIYARNMLAQLG